MPKLLKNLFVITFLGLLTISNTFGQIRTIADRARNAQLAKATSDFRDVNRLQGISVAIIKDGKMIFKYGVGNARKGKKANGDTVYHAASVSKIIAGTLAVKIQQNRGLVDGTKVNFRLKNATSSYLQKVRQTRGAIVTIPSKHKHTVEQLFSHLSCVKHYKGVSPPYVGKTPVADYYPKAIDALTKIWNEDFIPDCELGEKENYSTHAFTYAAAVLEQVTGRTAAELIRSEIAIAHNLPSLRASWRKVSHSRDPKIAIHYDENNRAIKLWNNSWKVFGGGLQISAADLARFGWKVRNGEIVRPSHRDNVLWRRVTSSQPYGIGWKLWTRNKWRVAEHGGKQPGVRTNLRVYREKATPLVIAVMTNREFFKKGDLNTLSDRLANILIKVRRIR